MECDIHWNIFSDISLEFGGLRKKKKKKKTFDMEEVTEVVQV